jgi:stage III sporulation protein AA
MPDKLIQPIQPIQPLHPIHPIKPILIRCLSGGLQKIFEHLAEDFFEDLEEVRLRVGGPVLLRVGGREFFLSPRGAAQGPAGACRATEGDIRECVERVSGYSLYAFEEEIRKGFITLPGGHRVGLTGRAVTEAGAVKTLKHFNGLHFRLAHQALGCADPVMGALRRGAGLYSTMILSPPGCGKTTLLRDVIRQVSQGPPGMNVGVVDERSEIAGCYEGVPQNDVGPRTDVLDACPKADGMLMLLRSMAPGVLAVDEIGGAEDVRAVEAASCAGVALLCTAHGASLGELARKPALGALLRRRVFERFVVLEHRGQVRGVYDRRFRALREGGGPCF